MKKDLAVVPVNESLAEIMKLVNGFFVIDENMDEEEFKEQGRIVDAYVKELLPNKIDAIGYVDLTLRSRIDALKQNKKDIITQLDREIDALEKGKERFESYFSRLLSEFNCDGENRLNGKTRAIWVTPSQSVKEDLNIAEVPAVFKNVTVKLPYAIWEELEKQNVPYSSVSIAVDKVALKNSGLSQFVKTKQLFKTGVVK